MAKTRLAVQPIEIIAMGKQRFIAGLVWKPVRSGRNELGEARATGKTTGGMYAYVIQRGRQQVQAGYAPKAKGVDRAYALAPVLISLLGPEWIGVFAIDQSRYVLVAVHGGAVLPGFDAFGDFDAIAGLLAHAHAELSGEADFAQSGAVIAPAVFGFGEDHRDLASVLSNAKLTKAMVLTPLSFGLTPRDTAIAVIAVVVGSGVYGYGMWDAQRKRAAAAALEAQAATDSAQQAAHEKGDSAPVPPPWITQPAAMAVLQACSAIAVDARVSVAGWRVSRFDCGPSSANATYLRGDGGTSVLRFKASARAVDGWAYSVNAEGDQATLSRPANGLVAKADDAVPGAAELRDVLIDYGQRVDGTITLQLTERPTPEPPPDNPEQEPPAWTSFDVTITSGLSPIPSLETLDLDGLRISGVSASIDARGTIVWNTKGVWYANR